MNYLQLATKEEAYAVKMRREFHRFPEVSNKEDRTIARVCEELKSMSIPYVDVPNGGVFGFLGAEEKGRTVLLRADVDALPGQESPLNGGGKPKETVSEIAGVSHTCGHDAHTAMLLAAAKVLKENEAAINGRVVLMFERGEEGTGNIVYLHKWAAENNLHIDGSFGMHVFPQMPTGSIAIWDEAAMAGVLGFNVKIIGKTAHGSEPTVGISPVDCFVAIYNGIQSLRMKYASPYNPMVFSVGQVNAGGANNIIPGELSFGGTFRLYNHEDGLRVKEEFIHMLESISDAYRCKVEHVITGPSLGLVNDKACSLFARDVFAKAFGGESILTVPPLMGSESHSLTARLWPGTYVGLGIMNEALGITARNHHECFDIDESALKVGAAAHVCYALEFLQNGPATTDRIYTGDMRQFYANYSARSLSAFDEV